MDHRNNHHPNYQSQMVTSTGTSSTVATSGWVYTDMSGDKKNRWLTFTYLTDNGPQTVNVDALMPTTVYRYLCGCGCEKVFEATGAEILGNGKGTLIGGPEMFAKGSISGNLSVTTNGQVVTPEAPRETHLDLSQEGDKTGIVRITTKGGHHVELDDRVDDGEDTEDLGSPVQFTHNGGIKFNKEGQLEVEVSEPEPKIEKEPDIGDIVWSKATGAGPFTIIAGTDINVTARKLEIKTSQDGDYVSEKARSDQKLRLDAWMVRDRRGRLLTFPKPEMTCTPQCAQFSVAKILAWAIAFATLIGTGWLLHH